MVHPSLFILFLAFTIVVQVSSQDQLKKIICQNKQGTIQCGRQKKINIISAFYGSDDDRGTCERCVDYFLFVIPVTCDCSDDVTEDVQEICNDNDSCQISNNNNVFGDPCSGKPTFLRLSYSCEDVTPTPEVITIERTTRLKTSAATTVTVSTKATFTTSEPVKTTGLGPVILPKTTIENEVHATTGRTTLEVHTDINTSGTTVEDTTTLRGNSDALDGGNNTVIIAATSAGVAAVVFIAGVAGFIFWKRRKRPDSTGSPTSVTNDIHVYDDVTTFSNIQLTNTGATYRTDGNCNPADPTNIADLYAKPNKKQSPPNVDQLYAKPMKKKPNVSDVDQLYAKPKKSTGASINHCDNELDNEEEGSVDNMLYESTGNITFTTQYTADNDEGYVDNELYGSTA